MWQSTRRCPCERGCGSATGITRRGFASGGDRVRLRPLSDVQASQRPASLGERRLCRRMVLRTMHGERSRCSQLTNEQIRLRRSEEKCARCRALWAPAGCALRWPLGRTEDVPCGTDVMTSTYSCAIRPSTPSERPSHEPPSRKSQTRAARRRRQCPKARRPAGSKRSAEH